MLAAFALWTLAVRFAGVEAIGPQGSAVGLARINRFVHELTGVHLPLYEITDWLSLIPAGFVLGFALLGLVQWIRRRSIRRVDFSLLALGGFYTAVLAAYVFFEAVAVNYRPVLIGGILEASYPSSTTMLVLCVMATAAMQLRIRMGSGLLRRCVLSAITAFAVVMVVCRLVSGVHWLSDIVGGILLSACLISAYDWIAF
ncbi:MAG: phosphatase PAP2 family protein [Clostridia bacterium]|nr:phosphatase PAP2 family protein [Clostridia bacterium]